MRTLTLGEIELLAAKLARGEIEDDRSERLRELPCATDPTALYYRLLRECARGARSIEIGTNRGVSAAHLADLGREVVTIDCAPECGPYCAALERVRFVCSDSLGVLRNCPFDPPYDLLFIDGDHSPGRVVAEYTAYRTLLRPGGLIFLDDVLVPESMRRAWDLIPDPKAILTEMHPAGGFGVAIRP